MPYMAGLCCQEPSAPPIRPNKKFCRRLRQCGIVFDLDPLPERPPAGTVLVTDPGTVLVTDPGTALVSDDSNQDDAASSPASSGTLSEVCPGCTNPQVHHRCRVCGEYLCVACLDPSNKCWNCDIETISSAVDDLETCPGSPNAIARIINDFETASNNIDHGETVPESIGRAETALVTDPGTAPSIDHAKMVPHSIHQPRGMFLPIVDPGHTLEEVIIIDTICV